MNNVSISRLQPMLLAVVNSLREHGLRQLSKASIEEEGVTMVDGPAEHCLSKIHIEAEDAAVVMVDTLEEEEGLGNGSSIGHALVPRLPLLLAGAHGLLLGHLLLLSLVYRPLQQFRSALCACFVRSQNALGGGCLGHCTGRSRYQPKQVVDEHLLPQYQSTVPITPLIRAYLCCRHTAQDLHVRFLGLEPVKFRSLLQEIPVWCGKLGELPQAALPASLQTSSLSSSQITPSWLAHYKDALLHKLTHEGYVAVLLLEPKETAGQPSPCGANSMGQKEMSFHDALMSMEVLNGIEMADPTPCSKCTHDDPKWAQELPHHEKGDLVHLADTVAPKTTQRKGETSHSLIPGHIAALWWQLMNFLCPNWVKDNNGESARELAYAVEAAWRGTIEDSSVAVVSDLTVPRDTVTDPQRLIQCTRDGLLRLKRRGDKTHIDSLDYMELGLKMHGVSLSTALWRAYWDLPSTLSPVLAASSSSTTNAKAKAKAKEKAKTKAKAKAKLKAFHFAKARGQGAKLQVNAPESMDVTKPLDIPGLTDSEDEGHAAYFDDGNDAEEVLLGLRGALTVHYLDALAPHIV
jgi:hypothetical protein